MTSIPVLIIGFNRPQRIRSLIDSLRPHQPPVVRIVIDGPRPRVAADREKIQKTVEAVDSIDWGADVKVHQHSENLGPGGSIPWAVSWVLSEFAETIIIEDDVTVGPQFLAFAESALELWKEDPETYAISGYNLVPSNRLASPGAPARYSKVPHSYAWATWRRAWNFYDPDMTWFSQQSPRHLREHLGSTIAVLRWRQFAAHVRHLRVNTWDYQWAMSIWAQNGRVVTPNQNLIEYHGFADGTHTVRNRSWEELPVGVIDINQLSTVRSHDEIDLEADRFLQRRGQRATAFGVAAGYFEAPAMRALKRWQLIRRVQTFR